MMQYYYAQPGYGQPVVMQNYYQQQPMPQQYVQQPQVTVPQQQPQVQSGVPEYTPQYVPNTTVQQQNNPDQLPYPTFQAPTGMPQPMPAGYNIMGNTNSKPTKGHRESSMSRNRRERGKAWINEFNASKLFNMTEAIIFDMACGNMTEEDNNDLLNETLYNSIINFCDLRCHNLGEYVNLMTIYRSSISNTLEGQAYNQMNDPCYTNLVGCLQVYDAVRTNLKQYVMTQNRSFLEVLYSFLGSDKPCRRNLVYINRLI